MDGLVVAFIAVLAILIGVTAALAIARGRAVERIDELVGGPADLSAEQRVRDLLDRTATAEFEAGQVVRDRQVLADILGIGIVRLDDALRVDVANTAACALLGRPPGTLVGLSAIEAFLDGRIEQVVAAARERGGATGELTLRQADGPTLLVRARRSPVRGVWLTLEDVSELRRLQRIRAEFIDNLSHELRTPLTTVSLLAETLVREADLAGEAIPARMRDRIAKIEVETGHLSQMVAELLDLSKIESGGPILLIDEVDLGRQAGATIERLQLFAERQGVHLAADVPAEGVPPVRGAEDRLGQVLVNLLHNAVKFSPEGGDVTVRVRSAGGEVSVAVVDHGMGIPRGDLDRVFERFYKVDRARSRVGGARGGTGLGLAIARHVVEGHGGRIRVESEEGRGSTFTFALPVAQGAGPPGSTAAAPGAATPAAATPAAGTAAAPPAAGQPAATPPAA